MEFCWKFVQAFEIMVILSLGVCQGRVLELDERFRDAKNEGQWLVMFYAPWCGHCKQLEPTWMELGDAVEGTLPVHVARLDCTKYSSLAGEFKIRGFPTIKFISGENEYEYRGARTKQDIIGFTQKAMGQKMTSLSNSGSIKAAQKKHSVFFLYLGKPDSELFKSYERVAKQLFLSLTFYSALPETWPSVTDTPTVIVFKDGTEYEMPLERETVTAIQLLNWISSEQISDFSELTGISYHDLKSTRKSFVIAVLPEGKSGELKSMAKDVALSRDKLFHPQFVFSWVIGNGIVNRMTYATINPPNIVVFNPNSYEYYVLNGDETSPINKNKLRDFLSNVIDGKLTPLGGSGFFQQVKRFFSDSTRSLVNFFRDSPIMASLVIGVPTFVISFLCYCICTMEDVSDEEASGTDSENEYDDEEERMPEYEGDERDVRQRHVEAPGHEETLDTNASDIAETDKDK